MICHMATSVDGRIASEAWPDPTSVRREYEKIHEHYRADAWLCGRITMEPFAKRVRTAQEVRREYTSEEERHDFVGSRDFDSFAFAIDPRGRLAWEGNHIDGDHVVAIVCERVSDEYLAFLRDRKVSYIIAGQKDVDLRLALEKVSAAFKVRTVMLEGGGRLNGAMLREGLVDEVSVLITPVADGRMSTPAVFDDDSLDALPRPLCLQSAEPLEGGIVWLRYTANGAK